jgi:hypothetical protein
MSGIRRVSDLGSKGISNIIDGSIVDSDINASAGVAQSKISNLTSDLALKAPLASPIFSGNVTLSNGIINVPNQPAFYVTREGGNVATNEKIPFDTVKLNRGNNFGFVNTTNARFTAPVTGAYYLFWGSIGNNINDVYRLRLHLNNVQYQDEHWRGDGGATGSEYVTNGSKGMVIQLAANDFAQIFFVSDGGNSNYGSSQYTHFGGWLIG